MANHPYMDEPVKFAQHPGAVDLPMASVSPPPAYSQICHRSVNTTVDAFGHGPAPEWGEFSTSGLDLLSNVDKVLVTKLFSVESMSIIDGARRFSVCTEDSKQMFSLIENDENMSSHADYRAFEVDALDPFGNNVFTVVREETNCCTHCFLCCTCFGKACRAKVKVRIGGTIIGSILQNCNFASPSFTVYGSRNYDGEEILRIDGGSAVCSPTKTFDLRNPTDSNPSGRINKKGAAFGGFVNNYSLNFPALSNHELKVMCIAAVILFDYRFYARPGQGRS